MTLAEIRETIPTAHYAPDPACQRCKGSGFRQGQLPCPCIFLAPEYREEVLASLAKTSKTVLQELKEQGENHPMVQTTARLVEVLTKKPVG